jgi:hypothetical protein
MFQPEFVTVRGLRILRLDYRGLTCAELETAFLVAGRLIASQPPRSCRILTLFSSRFDANVAEAFKRYVIGNGPYVLASAVLAHGFWRSVLTSVKLGARPDLQFFDDEARGMDWLTAFSPPPGPTPDARAAR